ncbi:MAG: hypothetical protein H2042_17810 [Rhizobiales bacterium]|nr:hypothetical protein [Hyphomicrobiales bacterium]
MFDDYTQESMPDELLKLAEQLQGAFESGKIPKPAGAATEDPPPPPPEPK